jgi:FMN phosphatase YigB (HAD superfamily)
MIKTNKLCYVFDLDDVLIRTDAKIYVYRNKAFFKTLTPKQYNNFTKELNDVLDFREFKDGELLLKAKHYKMWPLLKQLVNLKRNKKINADIIILTARNPEVKPYIYQLLKNDGIILDPKHIITMGDDRGDFNIAEEKKKVLEFLNDKYVKILFFDDDPKNIRIAKKIKGINTKLVESIKHLKPRSEEEIKKMISANKKFKIGLQNGSQWLIKNAIKDGATNVGIGHNKIFQGACKDGNLELVKILLKSPFVDPADTTVDGVRYRNDEYNYAIRHAAANGHANIIKLLLKDERVDPTARNNFALRWAAKNEHNDVIKLLLKDERVIKSLKTQDLIKILKLTK